MNDVINVDHIRNTKIRPMVGVRFDASSITVYKIEPPSFFFLEADLDQLGGYWYCPNTHFQPLKLLLLFFGPLSVTDPLRRSLSPARLSALLMLPDANFEFAKALILGQKVSVF